MRTSWNRELAVFGMLGAIAAACGKKDKAPAEESIVKDRGCVQGVAVDGVTGKRIALRAEDKSIYAIARNKIVYARVVQNPDAQDAKANLLGEYYLCGLPTDTRLPLLADIEGYEPFESEIEIPSTTANRTSQSQQQDIQLEFPTVLGNIAMYQSGKVAMPLTFVAVRSGAAVAGAVVQLRPTGRHVVGRSFLPPLTFRTASIEATTNEKGVAEFAGRDLSLGGIYEYTITPPAEHNDAKILRGEVAAGLRGDGASLTQTTHTVVLDFEGRTELIAVSKSTDENPYHPRGQIVLIFNQPVELVPGYEESTTAALSGTEGSTSVGTLHSTKPASVQIQGREVTLTPNWITLPDAKLDRGLTVTFAGLEIRAATAPKTRPGATLGALRVTVVE